jgi:2,5-diketo-D-gluconate reductase A
MTTLTMNDGRAIPAFGCGTYLMPDAAPIVREAIRLGYELFDTATIYENERGVAEGIGDAPVFVTTKLWREELGYDSALRGFEASLERLGRIDLYLIHWPRPSLGLFVETWKAFVRLRDEGRVQSIGVSNFSANEINEIADATGVLPALNQIELHPRFQQRELRAFHAGHGIVTQSWSPLGQGALLDHPQVRAVAAKHSATPAQAILAWHLHHGLGVIPKASTSARLAENLASASLALDAEDVAAIDALDDAGGRMGPDPAVF